MQDFLIMAVLHGQCDLGEPVEELIFREVVLASLTINSLKALLDLALHVTVVGVVHDNAELAFLGLVDFAETHDIWVIKHLKNLCLVQSFTALLLAHLADIDLLNDGQIVIGQALDQIGRTE